MLLHSALQLIKPSSHLADMESAESGQARWSWGWQGDKSKWERRRGSGEVANSSTVNSSKQVNAETREQPNKERGHCFSLPGGPAARTHRPQAQKPALFLPPSCTREDVNTRKKLGPRANICLPPSDVRALACSSSQRLSTDWVLGAGC